jgi:hypothetical protein
VGAWYKYTGFDFYIPDAIEAACRLHNRGDIALFSQSYYNDNGAAIELLAIRLHVLRARLFAKFAGVHLCFMMPELYAKREEPS